MRNTYLHFEFERNHQFYYNLSRDFQDHQRFENRRNLDTNDFPHNTTVHQDRAQELRKLLINLEYNKNLLYLINLSLLKINVSLFIN